LVMFFGLCNSPAMFQTMMDDIFNGLITEGVVVVYLDNILIFTETLEEHRRVTWRVMELLWKNNLFLKPEKCKFEKTEVEYLGGGLCCKPRNLIRFRSEILPPQMAVLGPNFLTKF